MTCPILGEPRPGERWAVCHEHDGYQVSTWGRVRNAQTGRLLKLLRHSRGYRMVHLGGAQRCRLVHRLVAFAHLGPPKLVSYQVDHVNFDRTWNGVRNLRWLPGDVNRWRWHTSEIDPAEIARVDAMPVAAGDAW
jgi:hypothetical protein